MNKSGAMNLNFPGYLIVIICLLLPILPARCTGNFKAADRFEGIKDGTLRVYIKTPFCGNLRGIDCVQNDIFMQKGRSRAEHLLKTYIRLSFKDTSAAQKQVDQISRYSASGRIIYRCCDAAECEAFLDFEIKPLLDALPAADGN